MQLDSRHPHRRQREIRSPLIAEEVIAELVRCFGEPDGSELELSPIKPLAETKTQARHHFPLSPEELQPEAGIDIGTSRRLRRFWMSLALSGAFVPMGIGGQQCRRWSRGCFRLGQSHTGNQ